MFETLMGRLGYEKRESASYTDAVVAAILGGARNQAASATETAVLETCSGMVGRAFASATVTGSRVSALDPRTLMVVGRTLVRKGEVLLWIRAARSGIGLLPVSTHAVTGGYDPATWEYELTLPGPSRISTVRVPEADVVHIRANVDPERPWRGVAPIDSARLDADLTAQLTKALRDEAAGPRGSFLPSPGGDHDTLKGDISDANGAMLVVETMKHSHQSGVPAPKDDWGQRRFGFNAPQAMLEARQQASDALMGALGLSAAIFRARDAASAVASYRHFAHSTIGPLGRLAQMELREKLDDRELTIEFTELRAADVAARANAFRKLVEGGIEVEKALGLSGMLADDSEV